MKRVLIIDDDCFKEQETIRESFSSTDTLLVLCDTKDKGVELIRAKALFDCIVLDWFLEGDDSSLSRLILKELEDQYYTPILIYSAQTTKYLEERASGLITYPENLIKEIQKNNFGEIKTKVEEWLTQNYTARLSNLYLEKVYEHIHKTFWDLNAIPEGNIAAVYKKIINDKGHIDWSNDFIINLLLKKLISDENFRSSLDLLINSISGLEGISAESKKIILNKILYNHSNPKYISNCDVIKITSGEYVHYGIIVTPDCDLSGCKTKYLEYIELRVFADDLGNADVRRDIKSNNSENHFYFVSLLKEASVFIDMVAVFKSKRILISINNDSDKHPAIKNRAEYNSGFQLENTSCQVAYVCSLVNPYKSEFLHKKHSHDSRVGIPEIFKYLNDN